MRYEAKHRYFKRLVVATGNFINLPYTLSKRHQESVSYRLKNSEGSNSSFIEKGLEIGPGKGKQKKTELQYRKFLYRNNIHI